MAPPARAERRATYPVLLCNAVESFRSDVRSQFTPRCVRHPSLKDSDKPEPSDS